MSRTKEHYLPLHPAQEGIYCEMALTEESELENIAFYSIYSKQLNFSILKKAWYLLVSNIDCLRLIPTSVLLDSKPAQKLLTIEDVHFSFIEKTENSCTKLALNDGEMLINSAAYHWMNNDINHPLNSLENETSKLTLITTKKECILYVKLHHLFIDGIALRQLNDLLNKLYKDLFEDRSIDWVEQLPSFLPEITKGQNYLSSARYKKDEAFWQNFTKNVSTFRLKRNFLTEMSGIHQAKIPQSLNDEIRHFCKVNSIPPLSLLLGVCSLYFSSIYERNDIPISTVIHGRHNKTALSALGMYSNILPILCEVDTESTPLLLLKKIAKSTISMLRHSRFPGNHIARLRDGEKDSDVIINYESFADLGVQQIEGCQSQRLISLKNTNPLMIRWIHYYEDTDAILHITYNQGFFSTTEIEYLAERFLHLLKAFITKPNTPLTQICLLTQKEKAFLTSLGNGKKHDNNEAIELHSQFFLRLKKFNNQTALIYQSESFSYDWLSEKVEQFIDLIHKEGNFDLNAEPKEKKALILFDRSPEFIITVLGLMRLGIAFVPSSPKYPKSRISFQIKDSNVDYIFTCNYKRMLTDIDTDVVPVIEINRYKLEKCKAANFSHNLNVRHLAYIMYTSGSTGKPKGIEVEHLQLFSNLNSQISFFNLSPHLTTIFYSSCCFDGTFDEYLLPLTVGGTIVIYPESSKFDYQSLFQSICSYRVNKVNFTPTLLANSLDELPELVDKSHIETILVGGEKLSATLATELAKLNCSVINSYGPTETTIDATRYKLIPNTIYQTSIIGNAIEGTSVFILNQDLSFTPFGEVGELCISGSGVARKYTHGQPKEQHRFLNCPYTSGRMYRTGDLVRWSNTGDIEYIGRQDTQVNINGVRIELSEIENKITSLEGIVRSVVTIEENKILAFIQEEEKTSYTSEILNNLLKNELPTNMLPVAYSFAKEFPLTSNGKVDVSSLPKPKPVLSNEFIAPKTSLELSIADIWAKVLTVESVGLEDDFFELGGDSLNCIQVTQKMNQVLEMKITITEMFKHRTIKSIIECDKAKKNSNRPIQNLNIIEPFAKTKQNKNKMFFIHPGVSNAHVYEPLVELLKEDFACFGVNNLNLISEKKYTDLRLLAETYLDEIDKLKEPNEPYYFVGWSLGGSISLELAAILEEKTSQRINLVLLDTHITTPEVDILNDQLITKPIYIEQFKNISTSLGFDIEQTSELATVLNIENQLMKTTKTLSLNKANILLFKAMKSLKLDITANELMLREEKLKHLTLNGIETISTQFISLWELTESNHMDLLIEKEEIANVIKQHLIKRQNRSQKYGVTY